MRHGTGRLSARSLLTCLAGLLSCATAIAEESLASLVPADVGLCVEARELAVHADRFLNGPVFARWREFPPLVTWNTKHGSGLDQIAGELGKQLEISPRELWRNVLGQNMLLAVWPGSSDGQVPGPGMIVVQAQEEQTLARLLSGFHAAQQRSGEFIAIREASHATITYRVSTLRRGGSSPEVAVAALGRIGLLTNSESLMREVLDLHRQPIATRACLVNTASFREAERSLSREAALRCFLNPRAWDSSLQVSLAAASSPDQHKQQLLETWMSLRYAAMSVSIGKEPSLEARLQFDPTTQPAAFAALLRCFAGPVEFPRIVPRDALAIATGRLDVGGLLKLAQTWTRELVVEQSAAATNDPPTARPDPVKPLLAGYEFFNNLAEGIGPELGVAIVPRISTPQRVDSTPETPPQWPFDLLVGLKINNRLTDDEAADRRRTMSDTLRALLTLAITWRNSQVPETQIALKSAEIEGQPLFSFAGGPVLPAGWEATCAIGPGYLLAGTSSAVILQAESASKADSLRTSQKASFAWPKQFGRPSQLVWINLKAVKRFVHSHSRQLSQLIAGEKGITNVQAEAGLGQIGASLNLADQLVLSASIDPQAIAVRAAISVDSTNDQ